MNLKVLKEDMDNLLQKCTAEEHNVEVVLGRKGLFTEIMRKTGRLSPEERSEFGAHANKIRDELKKILVY